MLNELLENQAGAEQIKNEYKGSDFGMVQEGIEIDNGVFQYFQGAEFPMKGHTSPETMLACNAVKRLFIVGVKTLSVFALFIGKAKLLEGFNDISWKIIGSHIRRYQYMTPCAKEIQDFIVRFLFDFKIPMPSAVRFAKIFSALIDYDQAYRYRIEDILLETSKDALIDRPIREILRLTKLLKERDNPGVADKFVSLVRFICPLLLLPRVKNAFRDAVRMSNFDNFQLDDIDRYWCSIRTDYRYEGLSNEERKAKYSHYKQPKFVKI